MAKSEEKTEEPSLFILSRSISLPSAVAYWTPLDLGIHFLVSYIFAFSSLNWSSGSKKTGVIFHYLLQLTMFYQHSPLCPIHLEWPYTAWLIASLSYASPSIPTRLWSMKRTLPYRFNNISILLLWYFIYLSYCTLRKSTSIYIKLESYLR